ncbi:mechanosensitive ion channel family protein [Micrococcus terreus]|uniref:mechanosensitive ion channel family protein n=1 Tax=Micrococcus terreus TaxID=574650 RepID=UPI0023F919AD|nr:mechanosensitive ion channel domain-containing protein [Micrococcus terreus]
MPLLTPPVQSLLAPVALAEPGPDPTGPVEEAVPDPVQESAEGTVEAMGPVLGILVNMLIGVAAAIALVAVVALVLNVVLRRRPELRQQIRRVRIPVMTALALLAARVALGLTAEGEPWFDAVRFLLLAGVVAALGWLALRVVRIVEERLLVKYQAAGVDDRRDRKIRTQTMLLRRILNAVIIVIAVAAILLAIPSVRAVGAGLLASAGVLSVVAGLAVQSTLTNVFAGVQLAFTDAIRVGDVVDMEDTFGTIEEITLSSVVVKIWDGRRMIYPSSHFTTTPFENWTRTGSALSGTVLMDVDWNVPLDAMRERLRALVESTELWDGRECSMQITDAVGGMVQIRAVVSARNSGDLWDLRCLVREDFVTFLRADHPEGIYAQRMLEAVPGLARGQAHGQGGQGRTGAAPGEDSQQPQPSVPGEGTSSGQAGAGTRADRTGDTVPGPITQTSPLAQVSEDSSMFTGSITAVERNREFAGPGEAAYQERKERQERQDRKDTGQLPVQARPEHQPESEGRAG